MLTQQSMELGSVLRPAISPDGCFLSGPADEPPPPVLEPGTKLGERFTIKRYLGAGRFGAVHQANDATRGEDVALKLINVGPASSPSAAAALRREASLHRAIADCRRVIRADDLHELRLGGGVLLALSMEYADGGSLRDWLESNRDDVGRRRSEGLTLFVQACEGLGAVHDAGIVHGDLKPENLLIAAGVLKVTDFGTAVCTDASEAQVAFATPTYTSPEQLSTSYSDELDPRSDIYALGILLFELMHPRCRPPFAGSYERLRELHRTVEPPPLPDAPPHVAHVVARCLQKDRAHRYRDVWELLDDLEGSEPGDHPKDDEWDRALGSMSNGAFADATRWCRAVLQSSPQHAEAERLLETLAHRYEQATQLYAAIAQDLDQRSVPDLLAAVRAAIEVYPRHPDGRLILMRLAARARDYREHMRAARRALLDGFWETGMTRLGQAQKLHPYAPRLEQTIEFLSRALRRIEELRGHVNRAIIDRDRDRALTLARCVDRYGVDLQRAIKRAASNGDSGASP